MTPRLLKRLEAAQYLSIHPATLDRKVKAGDLPGPVRVAGMKRWDREALDKIIDRTSRKARYRDPDEALADLGRE